ncbi:MAG: TolC family protein [Gemmatimonadetes bacterium]|nr:TolC family protein [Gemmatimonadota bacterium]
MVDRNGRTRFERWTPLGGAALLLVGLAVTPRLAAQERTVTLDEAIALALRAQPTIIQAQGDLDVAYAGKREAFGSYLPTLSASSSLSQNSSNRWNAATQQFLSQPRSVSYSTGLNASLVIFDGFSRLAESQAAGATVASADATLTNQRFQVILQTKQAFFNALAAAELVKVTQTQVARADQQLKISKDKLAAGSAIRSDTLRSTVELGNARLQLLNAQAQLATAEANLARLIGADGGVHAGGAPVMPDLAALDTAALRQEVVSRSPSVQAAQAQARAAGAQVGVSRAQYLPTVTANYSQSWAGARDSAGLAPSSFTNWRWGIAGPCGSASRGRCSTASRARPLCLARLPAGTRRRPGRPTPGGRPTPTSRSSSPYWRPPRNRWPSRRRAAPRPKRTSGYSRSATAWAPPPSWMC